MADFFDAEDHDDDGDGDNGDGDNGNAAMEVTGGASLLINGSTRRVETGASFMQTCKNAAVQAGFGKFRVFLNGVEVRPSTAPQTIEPGQRMEIRPFDEAGF